MTVVLDIRTLSVGLPAQADRSHALDAISLDLRSNEILCVVGESGSGKSVTAGAILGLLPKTLPVHGGEILFEGQDLLALSPQALRKVRGARIGMIFQEPMSALNPLHTIGEQIGEVFRIHTKVRNREIDARILALLKDVGLPEPEHARNAYPHELSGGQRQRAMIAMALALQPAVLIADEPTTALDVTTQARVLDLIRGLQSKYGMAVLFITHDFGVVAEIADRVAVMQHGRIVEIGEANQVLNAPVHPYTRGLIAAVPGIAPRPTKHEQNRSSIALPTADEGPDERHAALTVSSLTKTYRGKGFTRQARVTHALRGVSLTVRQGETLGIVGESGSGKSTLARCIMQLTDIDAGTIHVGTTELASLSHKQRRAHAPKIQMVFQDPHGSLNPRRTVGDLISQGPIIHGIPVAHAHAQARELLALVGLERSAFDRFPHEFSGGQRQRIGLARALALKPDVLVADEPVSALDVSIQAQVLSMLAQLREKLNLSLVFITHDLRVAAEICDRIAVMKDGEIVEIGDTETVFTTPAHPYTRQLLDSVLGREWFGLVERRRLATELIAA